MHTLLEIGLSNALAALVLAVVALVGTRLCRHPAVVHALWLLVLIKLLTPPLVRLPLSWDPPAPLPAVTPLPVALPPGELRPLDRQMLTAQLRALEQAPAEPSPERTGSAVGAAEVASLLWLAGSAVWFGWTAAYLVRFRRLLGHTAAAPAELQARVEELAGRLGLKRVPTVSLIPGQLPPMVWSFLGRPRLLFPARLLERVSLAQRDTLLLHELAHLARRDHWVRWLELLASGLYWWLPVLWLARRGLHAAEEECCDARVTRALPDSGRDYSLALVETLAFLSRARTPLPAGASGVGPIPQLKRRLTMILRGPSRSALPRLGGGILLGVALLLLPWAPTLAQQPSERPPSPQELRQRQIDALRQLLKALEDQQQAEAKTDPTKAASFSWAQLTAEERAKLVAEQQRRAAEADLKKAASLTLPRLPQEASKQAAEADLKKAVALGLAWLARTQADPAKARDASKEAERLKVEIDQARAQLEMARAQVRLAEAQLRQLQAQFERLSKASPSPKGTASSETIAYLRQRIEDLTQLLARAADADAKLRLQDEMSRVRGLLKLAEAPRNVAQQSPPAEMLSVRLRYANAAEVAKILEEVFNGKPPAGAGPRTPRIRAVADPATNTVLIQASPADMPVIRDLLTRTLDVDRKK
jgi:beta-lactamase regulating signal transducer with metallopeptidase domain